MASWRGLNCQNDIQKALAAAPEVIVPASRDELFTLALGGANERFEVAYDLPNRGRVTEAEVLKCRNGIVVNYTEPYMRRRDPQCMVVADDQPSDKPLFESRFEQTYAQLRAEVIAWLADRPLIVLPFIAGTEELGYPALLICPKNAAFFAGALADLQGMAPPETLDDFTPRAIIMVAPPFRHTHCAGKQIVVHHRAPEMHEILSLNLYPGPSAKKGVYGILLSIGGAAGWITAHGSTVQVVTPYDNIVSIMHEGASGGGKSEMLEYAHREPDGRLLLARNIRTNERVYMTLPRGCELRPVTDDMALCAPSESGDAGRLVVTDAEDAWFLRINHIDQYGTDVNLESLCVQPAQPLIFLNLYGVPNATCLIWEHIEDAPGVPCPNPRVIVPRHMVPRIVNDPVEVDVRSFGIRTPPCWQGQPSYGIVGMMHILPPALAWLWRMVAPRGHGNPSITDSEGLQSEGVGSYWPFATGRRIDHANLLLQQIVKTPRTRYTLIPNQHVGAWWVGFMGQWICREYLARRGMARFSDEQLVAARCPLLGYAMAYMLVEGVPVPTWMLQVNLQDDVGEEAYDAGAAQLTGFFRQELEPYLTEDDLDPLGRQIIEGCLSGVTVADYEAILPRPQRY